MTRKNELIPIKKSITLDLIKDYAEASGDFNPIHIYKEFGLKSQFKNWEKDMIDPVFLDLGSGKEYNKLNPDRWFNSSQEKQ